jgi:hypothetical protein
MTEHDLRLNDVSAVPPGKISVHLGPIDGIIRIEGRGFLTATQLARMFVELGTFVDGRRARREPVRVLVDNRQILIHSSDAADRIQQDTGHVYRENDRVAVVVESTLARMQFRRVLDPTTHRLFVSEEAAFAWLTSEDRL